MKWNKVMRVWSKIVIFIAILMLIENIIQLWENGFNDLSNPYIWFIYPAYSFPYIVILIPLLYFALRKEDK